MEKLVVLVLLTALLYDVSSAQNKMAYFKIGGELTLKPVFPDAIKNILWKLNGDLVAEWVKGAVPLVVYDRFKGRTTLDLSTGHLTMKNMSQKDEGEFSYEFNDKIQAVRYTGKAIKEVPKPTVHTKPLVCQSDKDQCGLSCYGDIKEAGPVTYSWKEGDGEWQEEEEESNITIIKSESFFFETVSCMMKNPISEKKSDPINNPFYVEPKHDPEVDIWWVELVVIPILSVIVAVCLGLLCWIHREKFRKWIRVKQDN
ncbi:lymphocyte function-associated antigen 3-like [Labrus bergylta]|uniref:lymphocyte function-associated antigen 3-like n=1 Tax=Labrus bergylta TaxID=56723 RepID=UPI0033130D7E